MWMRDIRSRGRRNRRPPKARPTDSVPDQLRSRRNVRRKIVAYLRLVYPTLVYLGVLDAGEFNGDSETLTPFALLLYYPIRNPLRPAPETLVTLAQPQTNDRRHPYRSRFSGEPQGGIPDFRWPIAMGPSSSCEAAKGCSHGASRWRAIRSLTGPGGAKRKPWTQTPGVPGSFLHTLGITSTPPIAAAHRRTAQGGTRCDPPPATPPARSSARRPTE